MKTLAQLMVAWRERAEQLERFAPAAATAFRDAANELEQLDRAQAGELVGLTEGAQISGYSANSLGRMVRQGRLKNLGKPNAPKIRRGDLPMKPSAVAAPRLVRHFDDVKRSAIASRVR